MLDNASFVAHLLLGPVVPGQHARCLNGGGGYPGGVLFEFRFRSGLLEGHLVNLVNETILWLRE
jgi:hypothetical protein